jgi:hypothetical protein
LFASLFESKNQIWQIRKLLAVVGRVWVCTARPRYGCN